MQALQDKDAAVADAQGELEQGDSYECFFCALCFYAIQARSASCGIL
jgi:hypothetical protein